MQKCFLISQKRGDRNNALVSSGQHVAPFYQKKSDFRLSDNLYTRYIGVAGWLIPNAA
jgi:hypothetical protein